MPGFQHRPGFLTPYFFGIDVTFSVTKMGGFFAEYYVGEREEHLESRENYVSFPKFEYACRNKDKERKEYYQNPEEGKLVATAKVNVGANWYNTEFKVNDVIVGTARTEVKYTVFDTTYYMGDKVVGYSHTIGNGSLYETTYTDVDGEVVGKSHMFAGSMELAATHDFPAVNERIRQNQLNKPKTEVKLSLEPHQAIVSQDSDELQANNTKEPKNLEPMRMFGGHIERKLQVDEKKRHRCSIL